MSRYQRSANSVSLFPFLAVLVCAMGALILLLIVTTRRIKDQAVARAREAQVEKLDGADRAKETRLDSNAQTQELLVNSDVESVKPANESAPVEVASPRPFPPPIPRPAERDWQAIIQQLKNQRDQHRQGLVSDQQESRNRRDKIEQFSQRIFAQENQIKALRKQSREYSNSIELSKRRQLILGEQIKDSRNRRRVAISKSTNAQSQFVFIPFDGQSGTTRRPIFIECTENEFRFLPEDITLNADDFDGFTAGFNPLLISTRALSEHWSDVNQRQAKSGSKPYVLLIVRPSGSVAFYMARMLLSHLKTAYGYELVEEDFQIAFPEPDPRAVQVCREAIERTFAERDRLIRTLTSRGIKSGSAVTNAINRAGVRGTAHETGTKGNGTRQVPATRQRSTRSNSGRIPSQRFFESKNFRQHTSTGDAGTQDGPSKSTRSAISKKGFGRFMNEDPDNDVLGGSRKSNTRPKWRPRANASAGSLTNSQDRTPSQNTRGIDGNVPKGVGSGDRDGEINGSKSIGNRNGDSDTKGPSTPGSGDSSSNSVAGRQNSASQPRSAAGEYRKGNTSNGGITARQSGVPIALPTFQFPRSSTGKSTRQQLREKRRRWGIRNPFGLIGFERRLAIEVLSDRLIVAGERTIPVGRGESSEQLLSEVITAIDNHARSWGKPKTNFYWIPAIDFVVSPGGIQYYERLHGRLREGNVFSTVSFRLDTPQRETIIPYQLAPSLGVIE
jgi:hypothetical protein